MQRKHLLYTIALIASTGVMQAQAGGLWLNEYGDFSAGRSAAGAEAGLDDAAAIFYNPASATRLGGKQLFVSAGAFLVDTKFDIDYSNPVSGNNNGGDAGLDVPAASMAYVHDLDSEKWSVGFSIGGLSGAGLEYAEDWVGRFQATDVELLLMAIAPTAAFKVSEKLSIGASFQIFYSSLDLKLAVPSPQNPGTGSASIDGTDTGIGFTLGGLYEFNEYTRMGLLYQSELEPDFSGKLKINVPDIDVESNTKFTMAQTLRLSLHHDLNDRLGLALTVGWDDWSAMDEVFVSLPDQGRGLKRNWEDTYHYAAGLEYRINDDWQITSGIAYDTSPVSAINRTADMPVDRQVRYSAGARHQFSDTLTIGGFINFADLGSAKIYTESWGGEYKDNSLLQLGINFSWKL